MKKFFTILFLLSVAEAIPVSCLCPCGCGPSTGSKSFDILSFGVETTSMAYVKVDTASFYPFDEVIKVLLVEEKNYITQEVDIFRPGVFGNYAFACEPAPISAIQKISDIKIISQIKTTINDVSDLINIGDDITSRFEMRMAYYSGMDFQSIDQFINQDIFDGDKVLIKLHAKPFKDTKLMFDILVTLTDGKSFQLKNEILKVK